MSYDPHRRRAAPLLKPLTALLLACAAVVLLLVTGALAQRYGSRQPAAATAASGPATPAPATRASPPPGIGDPVRDGRFEFVVSRLDCSRRTVGVDHLERTAKGRYCVVSLSVRNIADEPQFFVGHAQKAFDAAGTGYGTEELAGVYANRNTRAFLDKVDPGERVTGKLVFDIPETAELTTLELHDSLLSGGVEVTLD